MRYVKRAVRSSAQLVLVKIRERGTVGALEESWMGVAYDLAAVSVIPLGVLAVGFEKQGYRVSFRLCVLFLTAH